MGILMIIGVASSGCALFLAVSTILVGAQLLQAAGGKVDLSGRSNVSTGIILAAVVGLSVLIMVTANKFFKRK